MKRSTTTFLASLALSASAHAFGQETAADPQACPAGTTVASPDYKWENGHFVRDGWACVNQSGN
jgi:hypothetical protein